MRLTVLALLVLGLLPSRCLQAADPLIVHEWGTFTSFQDQTGQAIGGINTDDEPVPGFVHRIGNLVHTSTELAGYDQGIPEDHPCVTMRLETPVIYFHGAPGQLVRTIRVDVAFHGGWLTEFYPQATVTAPGVIALGASKPGGGHYYQYGQITPTTTGTLDWPTVQVGAAGNGPNTNAKVWTTTRKVSADAIKVGSESEKFLFYRGVGNLDSPLRVERIGDGDQIRISLKAGLKKATAAALAHSPMWLVRVSPDSHLEWQRGYQPAPGNHDKNVLGVMDANFLKTDAHSVGLASLHKDMAQYLVKAGLFPDEAEAMLGAGAVSYFKSPGTRLFFLVPGQWSDSVLPLHITGNPPTVRIMVGRIEILTPRLEGLVKQIESVQPATAPATPPALARATPTIQAAVRSMNPALEAEAALANGAPMSEFVDAFPRDEKAYILLGRFRDALLIYEQAKHPNPRLAEFMVRRGIALHTLPIRGVSAEGQ